MAALFGIPAGALPSDWAAFGWYTAEMVESSLLGVGEDGRALGHSVLSGVGTRVRPPRWYRALTAFWMPPRLRTALELSFGALEEEAVRRAARWLRLFYLRIPGLLRLVGPFHEADAPTTRPLSRSLRNSVQEMVGKDAIALANDHRTWECAYCRRALSGVMQRFRQFGCA
jgi:uncharacterized protein (DUF2236 family)